MALTTVRLPQGRRFECNLQANRCMIGLIKSEQHYHKMNSFAALADPTRRQIIEALAQGPLSSGEIAGRFEISAPAISQHLKALRVARLVRVRVEAQWRIYELDKDGVDNLVAWVNELKCRVDDLEVKGASSH